MRKVLKESRSWSDSLRDNLSTGNRLHIMSGSPWLTALGAAQAGQCDGKLWRAVEPFDKDDLLLTVLDTNPRTILSLELATKSGTSRIRAFHVEEIAAFTPLILTTDIETLIGTKFPSLGPVPRDFALSILGALAALRYQSSPQIHPGTPCSSLSTGQRAVALSDADGRCAACEREFGGVLGSHGLSGLDVHIHDVADRRTGMTALTAVVLCAGCHRGRSCGPGRRRHSPRALSLRGTEIRMAPCVPGLRGATKHANSVGNAVRGAARGRSDRWVFDLRQS